MCYSEPLYEERKKQLNSTTNVSISEEISSGPDDISSEIEMFVVEFSCFFLSSYILIYGTVCRIYTGVWQHQKVAALICPQTERV